MIKHVKLPVFIMVFMAAVFAPNVYAAGLNVPNDLEFTVLRDGDNIGTHVMRFSSRNNLTKIDIKTDIAVKLAFITVYRFEHKATEEWFNGDFFATDTVTNDDGTAHKLKVSTKGKMLVVKADGKVSQTPVGIMPASLWNPDIVKHSVLLNTLNGRHMKVTIKTIGKESVDVKGTPVSATHYAIHGELERELWFDDKGTLVQVRFKDKTQSEITYVLQ